MSSFIQISGLLALNTSSPLASTGGKSPTISITKADGITNGYLSSIDWTIFNSKQAALGFTPANKAGDTFTGNIFATNLSGTNTGDETNTTIKYKLGAATSSNDGYLTSLDWSAFNSKVSSSLLGVSNGVATLDSGGKIPVTQLPSSIMNYHGTYDIVTNTPALSDGMVGADPGDVYICTTAGTRTFGPGNTITVGLGDWLIYSQSLIWQKSDNSDAVVSVNGYTGVVSLGVSDISGAIGGSGTTNYLTKFTGTSTVGINSLLYDTGSRIGLGITTPSALFHINNTGATDSFLVEDESNPDSTPFVIDSAGNVIIGTVTPITKFTVNGRSTLGSGTDSGYPLNVICTNDSTNPYGLFVSRNSNAQGLHIHNMDGSEVRIDALGASSKPLVINNKMNEAIKFATNNVDRVTISNTGNLGIGILTPLAKLHVNATAIPSTDEPIAYFTVSDDSSSFLRVLNGTAGNNAFVPTFEGKQGGAQEALYFIGNGTTDTGILPVVLFDARIGASAVATRPLFKWTNLGVDQMTMTANGNLGIGITIPTAKLHVNNTSAAPSFLVEDSTNPDSTAFVIDSKGMVGIGVSPSSQYMTYSASLYIETFGSALGSSVALRLRESSSNSQFNLTPYFSSDAGKSLALNDDTSGLATQVWTEAGNVGIGITNPTARLHITHTNESDAFKVEDSTNPDASPFVIDKDGNVGIGNASPGGTAAKVTIQSSDTEGTVRLGGGNGAGNARLFLQSSATDAYIDMYGNNQYLPLRIDAGPLSLNSTAGSGNVGIGTTTPSAKLDVLTTSVPSTGEILAQFRVSDDINSHLRVINSTGVDSSFIPVIEGKNSGTSVAFGTIGSGTTDTGNTAITIFDSRIGNNPVVTRPLFSWNNYGTSQMLISANGNVGIGTTNPGSKLEVNGDLKVSIVPNATTNTGKILVSDGGVVKYRTAAETISDILTVTTTGSSGPATLTGTTLNIPQYTGGTGGSQDLASVLSFGNSASTDIDMSGYDLLDVDSISTATTSMKTLAMINSSLIFYANNC